MNQGLKTQQKGWRLTPSGEKAVGRREEETCENHCKKEGPGI